MCNLPVDINAEKSADRLLGVQLNDEVLFNGIVDVVSLGKRYDLAAEEVLVLFKPLGSEHGSVLALSDSLEACCGTALLLDLDYVAYLDDVGGNVDLLAVYGEVSVVNELSCLTACSRKTESEYDVVESALNDGEELLTCLAFSLLSLGTASRECRK